MPVLIVCGVFDAGRFMFVWFMFFGPALAGTLCTIGISNTAFGETIGVVATGLGCGAAAATAGFFGVKLFTAFGALMAMITGFAGWLAVGLWLLIKNTRIFKENALPFALSLLISEVPFIGSVPALTGTTWRMYHHQIKVETAALKKYQEEVAAEQAQRRREQVADLAAARAVQRAQIAQQEEALLEAEREESEIPDEMLKAA